jgi:hypothetical protein
MKKNVDIRKQLCSTHRMKNKLKFIDILKSVRKAGGRPSVAFVSKVVKAKGKRNDWKKDF